MTHNDETWLDNYFITIGLVGREGCIVSSPLRLFSKRAVTDRRSDRSFYTDKINLLFN